MESNGLQVFGEDVAAEQQMPVGEDPLMGQMEDQFAGEEHKVTQEEARYFPSTQRCQNCEHFMEGACEIVAGDIDPNGICILYRPGQLPMDAMGMEEAPMDAGMTPEAPMGEAEDLLSGGEELM